MHSLDLGVVLKGVGAQFTAKTRLLEATEGSLVVDHVVAVDPDGSSPERVGDADGSVNVLGVDGGGKTVRGAVTNLDGLLLILELLDGDDGAEDLLLGDLHVAVDIGEDGRLDEVTLGSVTLTTGGNGSTLLLTVVDVLHDAVELQLRDLRALEGVGSEGVAELVGSGALLEAGNELVVDALLDQDTGTGAAALAVVEEDTEVGPRDSVIDVGVVEDNVRGLATQLQSDLLQVALGGGLENHTTNQGRTGEGNLVDIHVAGDSSTGDTAEAREDINHTSGEASFLDELGGIETRHGGLLSSLEDNDVTGSDGRSNLPGPHQKREVPGDDLTTDTNGLVAGVGKRLRVGVNGLAVNLIGPATVVAKAAGGGGNIALSHGEGLAVVKGFNSSQDVAITLEEVGQLDEEAATFGGSDLAPLTLEGGACCLDGIFDIILVRLLDGYNRLLVGGVDGLKSAATLSLDELIVDEPKW